jgi:hypothetical protein
MRNFGALLTAIATGAVLAAAVATPSDAAIKYRKGPYDGLWSVSILTQLGPCDPSYRYPARIIGGQIHQADSDFSYQISGAVNHDGGISVTVSKGGQSATGYGRLNATRGAGWWRADGGQCSGVWNAARRG